MLLELYHLSYIHHGQIILEDIHLSFEDTGLVFIHGASGSGKSTLLHLIGGIASPSSGEVLIDGASYSNPSRYLKKYRYQRDVSFIFQGYHLIEEFTVYENLSIFGFDREDIKGALKRLEMLDALNIRVDQLSGGQKQRIAVARAILMKPKIILADEPTAALDIRTANLVREVLEDLSKTTLVIVVSHDYTLFKECAHRIIEMDHGKIIRDTKCFKIKEEKRALFKPHQMSKKGMLQFIRIDLHSKKGRLFFTTFAQSLTVMILLLIFGIYGGMEHYLVKMKEEAFEKDCLIVEKNDYPVSSVTDAEKNQLGSLEGLQHIEEHLVLVNLEDREHHASFEILSKEPSRKIQGEFPQKKDEILISYDLAKLIDDTFENVIGKTYTLYHNDTLKEYVISGYTLDKITYRTIYYPRSWQDNSMYTLIGDGTLRLNFDNDMHLKTAMASLKNNKQFNVYNDFYLFENNLQNMIHMAIVGLFIFGVILFLINSMMTYLMHYASLLQKRKELITLELFGLLKKEIYQIFLSEGILMAVGTLLFSSGLFYLLRPLFNLFIYYFIDSSLRDFIVIPFDQTLMQETHIPFFAYGLCIGTLLLMTIITMGISLFRILRQDKSDLLKEDDLC